MLDSDEEIKMMENIECVLKGRAATGVRTFGNDKRQKLLREKKRHTQGSFLVHPARRKDDTKY